MFVCRWVGMSYIALCSGADANVNYINALNLHRLQCICIQGMSLQNAHSLIIILMPCIIPVWTKFSFTKHPTSYILAVIIMCDAEFQYEPSSYPANIVPVAQCYVSNWWSLTGEWKRGDQQRCHNVVQPQLLIDQPYHWGNLSCVEIYIVNIRQCYSIHVYTCKLLCKRLWCELSMVHALCLI